MIYYDGVYVDIHHIFNITSVVLFSCYLIVCRWQTIKKNFGTSQTTTGGATGRTWSKGEEVRDIQQHILPHTVTLSILLKKFQYMYYSHYWWHVIVKDFLNLKILPACMSFILRIIMITKRDVRNILTFVWFVCAHMIWFFWQSKKPAPRTTLGTGKSEDDSESSGDEDVEDDEEVYESIVSDHARLSLYLQWPHNTYNHLWLYFK